MSNPKYGWWSYVKYLTKKYPELKMEYDDLHRQNIAANTAQIRCGSGSTSRTTESSALRKLPPAKQADYDAVAKAIEQTKRLKTGQERLQLIDMVYWKKSHTLDGASYAIGYSYEQAKLYHRDFLRLVGFNRGLEDVG